MNPHKTIEFYERAYSLTSNKGYRFYSTSLSILTNLIYIKHKNQSFQPFISYFIPNPNHFRRNRKVIFKGLQYLKNIDCVINLNQSGNSKVIAHFINDNGMADKVKSDTCTGYLYYTKNLLVTRSTTKQSNTLDYLEFNPTSYLLPYLEVAKLKTGYFPDVFGCKVLTLQKCDLTSLYQYIP